MIKNLINENELPMADFEKLGVYKDGKWNIGRGNLNALLAGRRTSMLSLSDLHLEGIPVQQLNTKLSLSRKEDGGVQLNIHPIYLKARRHPLLSEKEERELAAGVREVVHKIQETENGKKKKIAIQYDEETREFVAYDPDQVQVPFTVNSERLSDKQQEDFRNGKVVQLKDGTRFQHSSTNHKGLRADRTRLILSVLLDGGISYIGFRAINNLIGRMLPQDEGYTKGYKQALADMKSAEHRDKNTERREKDTGQGFGPEGEEQTRARKHGPGR